jgi:hypothetical protein
MEEVAWMRQEINRLSHENQQLRLRYEVPEDVKMALQLSIDEASIVRVMQSMVRSVEMRVGEIVRFKIDHWSYTLMPDGSIQIQGTIPSVCLSGILPFVDRYDCAFYDYETGKGIVGRFRFTTYSITPSLSTIEMRSDKEVRIR